MKRSFADIKRDQILHGAFSLFHYIYSFIEKRLVSINLNEVPDTINHSKVISLID